MKLTRRQLRRIIAESLKLTEGRVNVTKLGGEVYTDKADKRYKYMGDSITDAIYIVANPPIQGQTPASKEKAIPVKKGGKAYKAIKKMFPDIVRFDSSPNDQSKEMSQEEMDAEDKKGR